MFIQVDTAVGSGSGVIQVVPVNTSDQEKMNAILANVGQSVTYMGVTVQLITKLAESDTVQIKY